MKGRYLFRVLLIAIISISIAVGLKVLIPKIAFASEQSMECNSDICVISRVSLKGEDVINPGEIRGPFNCVRAEGEFDDIFGTSGYFLERGIYQNGQWVSDWVERIYYTNENEIIAYSCGFGDDYLIDIDADGTKELLCNCENGERTKRVLKIYKYYDGKIFCAEIPDIIFKEKPIPIESIQYESWTLEKETDCE